MYRLTCIVILAGSALISLGQQQPDPMAILAGARERLLSDVQRLPRYTCVQTIRRDYFPAPFHYQQPDSCKEVISNHDKRMIDLTRVSWDRLRLDVAVSGSHEIFSWVGSPKLGEATLAEIAGKGPLGSGDFGPFVTAVFTIATVKFEKLEVVGGRSLLEYSYDVPQNVSRYEVLDSKRNTGVITAYSGTFLLDPVGSDLVRLTIRTAELPPETSKCQATTEVDYARVLIHNTQTLLPHETRLRVVGRLGEEALATTSYADCHEYSSKSVLHFEPAEITESGASSPAAPSENPFPPGLHFDLRVVTPIDSDIAAAGDPLDAVLRSPIRDKKGNVLAAAGTHLHGRLVQVEYSFAFRTVEIRMEFDAIDIKGNSAPIGVILDAQNATVIHFMGVPRSGDIVSANGRFLYYGNHLKLTHLDTKGTTAAPSTEKKTSGQ